MSTTTTTSNNGNDMFAKIASPSKGSLGDKQSSLSTDVEYISSDEEEDNNNNTLVGASSSSNGSLSIYTDEELLSQKHPLQNTWVMWYDRPDKNTDQGNWLASLKKICEFNTVEDFWAMYTHLIKPTKLTSGSNYHCFKKGIMPAWETEANEAGGKWTHTIKKDNKRTIDELWLNTLMACIGDQFIENEVNGCVMSIRSKGDKICLWTATGDDEEVQMSVGQHFKNTLSVDARLCYHVHADALKKGGSYNFKGRYVIE
eukprot:TRINITY_DN106_c0_g3_i1.p1 TRINITY_DN106_c0_g3~~TRINITY_DN106_c0_g3_i1.p1  ORF type:complete len:258 (-),score=65.50 TRINITY_DN106_c0_g3_i1:234-1007(-)